MAKHKKIAQSKYEVERNVAPKEPKLTRAAFMISFWAIALSLLAQLIIAVIAYPSLPARIPSSWIGSASPYGTIPSWFVFLIFPGSQIVLMLLALITPKDSSGRRIMESGKAVALMLLAALFTALQSSIFHVGKV
jgi:uncharacterized membrane protein